MDDLGIGDQAVDRPHQHVRHGHEVTAQVAEGAEPGVGAARAPRPGQVRIGLVVFVDPASKVDDTPDPPCLDQRPRVRHGGIVDVVVADHRAGPCRAGGGLHLLGLPQR